ncbi:ABC transporter ATP-binding protein/permease [Flavobacteriaceae bacterium]|nr:ABC transporter ATP-binding protein/permease [Flavobacteriaceae bacterium]
MVVLTLLLFVGMVLEVFGLGILIPAISILLDPEMIDKTPMISSIKNLFPNFSHQNFVIFFLGATVLLYFIKSLFLVLLTHKQNRFLNNMMAYIANNLFSSYLTKPYSFHLNRNASELIKNIQVEMNFLGVFFLSFITIFIEGGFVVSVLSTLIYIEPFGAISIGLFYGLLSMIFLQFTKRKLSIWGKLRQELDTQVSKIALEGLGGIKDLLILGRTSFFIDEYFKKNYLKARMVSNQGTVIQIPRFFLELISIAGLVSFIILLLFQGKDTSSLITILGVFVAATFRMIPSFNRIITAVQSLKYYSPALDVIYEELKLQNDKIELLNEKEVYNFKNKIEFKKVNFSFKKETPVLKDVNLKISKGQTIGIIGESGSGKSTLVDLLIGLHKPTSGEILIDGNKNVQIKKSWRNNIGYVSQSIYLTDDTIENNIALGVLESDIDKDKIREILKQVRLEDLIRELELGIHTKVGERGVQLSGGQRQRIGIARALYHNPEILILDEATSALDNKTEKEVMKSLDYLKSTKTIIMIAHRISTLKECDVIFKIENGHL